MTDAYEIYSSNPFAFLVDSDANDPQAILKQKAKKAKKAAKKLAGKENAENDGKAETKTDIKLTDDKKVKFVVPGKGGQQSQQQQQQQPESTQKSRSMKDTQNIQGNGNSENGTNNFRESKNRYDRDRNYGNNRYNENGDNREQRVNRRYNKDGGADGNQAPPENGFGSQNRGYRMNNGYRNNNENNSNNGQDLDYQNNQRDQRDSDRPARRQGFERNFGNRDGNRRGYDGQRRNFDGRGGKREFDRQSGSDKTGVKAVEKREGGGAHNWGTHKQDIEDLNKNVSEPDLKEDGNSVEPEKSEENLAVEQLTLDEYRNKQGERAKPVYNTRRAGEGEDKKKWKNYVPLQKKKDEEKSEDEYEYDPSWYSQRKRGVKYVMDIDICFNDSKRLGYHNSNNNNGRRRRNRDGDGRRNDGVNKPNAPQVDDRNFPSLG